MVLWTFRNPWMEILMIQSSKQGTKIPVCRFHFLAFLHVFLRVWSGCGEHAQQDTFADGLHYKHDGTKISSFFFFFFLSWPIATSLVNYQDSINLIVYLDDSINLFVTLMTSGRSWPLDRHSNVGER